jgi:hypothetical protein
VPRGRARGPDAGAGHDPDADRRSGEAAGAGDESETWNAEPEEEGEGVKHPDIIPLIEKVIRKNDELDSITGEVLATLRLNMDRGNIRYRDGENDNEILRKLLEQWEARYRTVTGEDL